MNSAQCLLKQVPGESGILVPWVVLVLSFSVSGLNIQSLLPASSHWGLLIFAVNRSIDIICNICIFQHYLTLPISLPACCPPFYFPANASKCSSSTMQHEQPVFPLHATTCQVKQSKNKKAHLGSTEFSPSILSPL